MDLEKRGGKIIVMEQIHPQIINQIKVSLMLDLYQNYGVRKETLRPFCVGEDALSESEFQSIWKNKSPMPRWMFFLLMEMRALGGPERATEEINTVIEGYLGVATDTEPDEAPGGGGGDEVGPTPKSTPAAVYASKEPDKRFAEGPAKDYRFESDDRTSAPGHGRPPKRRGETIHDMMESTRGANNLSDSNRQWTPETDKDIRVGAGDIAGGSEYPE